MLSPILFLFCNVLTLLQCWETALGAEMYRLIIVDFIVQVLFSAIIMVVSCCCASSKAFDLYGIYTYKRTSKARGSASHAPEQSDDSGDERNGEHKIHFAEDTVDDREQEHG